MDELARWLGQQLDEDEQIARAAVESVGLVPGAVNWQLDESASDEGGHYWRITTLAPNDTVPTVELVGSGMQGGGVHEEALGQHIVAHDPARVLREIDAKRRTLERHSPHSSGTVDCSIHCERTHPGVPVCNHDGRRWPCPDVLDLTAGYADRPGFKESWRP
jgi:hypothetical protein